MTKIIATYHSKFEKSNMKVTKENKNYFLWVYKNNKIMGFDTLQDDKSRAKQVFEWFKKKEVEGVSLTQALLQLEAEADAIEYMARGGRPSKNEKVKM